MRTRKNFNHKDYSYLSKSNDKKEEKKIVKKKDLSLFDKIKNIKV